VTHESCRSLRREDDELLHLLRHKDEQAQRQEDEQSMPAGKSHDFDLDLIKFVNQPVTIQAGVCQPGVIAA
jgi:hypothetical protein